MDSIIGILIYLSIFVGIGYFSHLVNKDYKERVRIRRQQMKENHREYLASDWWKQRKNDFFNKFGRSCTVCGSSLCVDLHHKNYFYLYREFDKDLVPLCHIHHEAFHKSGFKIEDTDIWVIKEREKIT